MPKTTTSKTKGTPAVDDGPTLPTLLPSSDMPLIHRDRGALGAVLRQIPAWVDAAHCVARLHAARPSHRNVATPEVEVDAYLEAALAAGKDIDLAEVTEHARSATAELGALTAVVHGFETATRRACQQLDQAVRDHRDTIHAHLTDDLHAVLDEARGHSDALGITAEEAIAGGLTEQYQALESTFKRFQALRLGVTRLNYRLGWNITVPGFPELSWIANPTECFEHWRAWRADGALVNPTNPKDRKRLTPPWPDASSGLPKDEESRAWFTYLVRTPEAEPWLPTPKQYAAVAEKLSDYFHDLRPAPHRLAITETDPPHPGYGENTQRPARHPRAATVARGGRL